MASDPGAPDWYSHDLNRVAYYRLAALAAAALPRPARLRLARGLGRLLARALPAERMAVRRNLGRVLAGAPPAEIEAFPLRPFVLARAVGAAVVPAFCAMAPGGRYRLEIDPPIWVKPGEELTSLATMVVALDRVIRAHPAPWFNFFDAWSPPHGRS